MKRLSLLGLFLLCWIAFIMPFFCLHTPFTIHLEEKNVSPCWNYWFGTDDLGRDLFSRICCGLRISLSLGFLSSLFNCLFGTFWGTISAYLGGWIDEFLMRICDILNAIPTLMVILLLTTLIGSGFNTIFIGLILFGWINLARVVRSELLLIKQLDYISLAKSMGTSPVRIIFFHMLPNAKETILTTTLLSIPHAIFLESFLSFLGLGISDPYASLGTLIQEGLNTALNYSWRLWIPSSLLVLLMIFLEGITKTDNESRT